MLEVLCFLIGVAVANCDARAQGYTAAVLEVPSSHWQRVRLVRIEDRDTGKTLTDLTVVLPAKAREYTLRHEVGHVLAYTTDSAIDEWRATFWPHGVPLGRMARYPTTVWEKTRNADLASKEDQAESYARVTDDDLDPARKAWIREQWFSER